VQTSPRRLGLQILCKSGRSIERVLDDWPTLPLVVRSEATRISRSLPANVVMAFHRPNRICEIDIGVTESIIESIAETIQQPFLGLQRIRLTSKDAKELPVLSEFLGGSAPLLEDIELEGIAIPTPAIKRLLLSTNNLVRLCLTFIPNPSVLASTLQLLAQSQATILLLWNVSLSRRSASLFFTERTSIWKGLWQESTLQLSCFSL